MPDRTHTEALAAVQVTRLDGRHCAVLRIREPNDERLRRAGEVLGFALPTEPLTVAGQSPRALWLAPGEWLLVQETPLDATLTALTAALGGSTALVADITHGRSIFSIRGPAARDFLARGCNLDLHARVFPTGRCAQTLFAQIYALIHLVSDAPEFHVYVDSSLEAYLEAWFDRVRAVFAFTETV